MNRLKNSILIIAAITMMLGTLPVLADDSETCPMGRRGGPGMGGHAPLGPMGRVADALELTDEQKAEIRAIMDEEMPAAREKVEARVNGVLTAEQQEKLAALKAERPERPGKGRKHGMRGPGGHAPGGPGARLERMADALELTDDQKSQMREILDRAREEHRAEMQEKIDSVLTPEQQARAEELREQRRERMGERGATGAWEE